MTYHRIIRNFRFLAVLLPLIVVSSPGQFLQQGSKLVGSGAVGSSEQGWSVSLSADGNTAIVGGWYDNEGEGAVWVFTRSGGLWSQQGDKLVGMGAVGYAGQGKSVSLSADGNTAIVGGIYDSSFTGAAWVFTRSGGVWTQQTKLVGTGTVGHSYQGRSVSLSADGNTAIVGGADDNFSLGAAWIFIRSGGVWTQQAKLVGTGGVGNAQQGKSVSLSADGNTAIVGGWWDNSQTGAAWIFTRTGGVWTQQGSKLLDSGVVGISLQGESVSLSADGNTAIVGGWDTSNAARVWVYTRSNGIWTQQDDRIIGTGDMGVLYGTSVSLSADGNTAIVGWETDNSSSGAAWVFKRFGGLWWQYGSKLTGTGAVGSARQGRSVSLSADGHTAILGGFWDNSKVGAAWVFTSLGTDSVLLQLDVGEKWNLVSVPLTIDDYSTSQSFPSATGDAFSYHGGYQTDDTLENGVGYWLKFTSAHTIEMIGNPRLDDTISVDEGWNMIGSLSLSISVSHVGSIPGGIQTSNFYGYEEGYTPSSIIEPGKGYWVKVSQAGQLILSSTGSVLNGNRIRIIDAGDLPPLPNPVHHDRRPPKE